MVFHCHYPQFSEQVTCLTVVVDCLTVECDHCLNSGLNADSVDWAAAVGSFAIGLDLGCLPKSIQ